MSSDALFHPKCTKCPSEAGLCPDPLEELKHSQDLLTVPGEGVEVKEGRGEEEGRD